MDQVINYKCPNCAAPLEFGIQSQQWDCHFCNSTFTKAQLDEFAKTSGTGQQQPVWEAKPFAGEDTVAYSCPSCGGQVLADRHTAATFCAFCHNPTIIAEQLSGQYRPARLIPFKLEKGQAVAALQKLCKGKPLMPKEFLDIAQKGEVTGLYVPYWLFSANYAASLTATGQKVMRWQDVNFDYIKTDTYQVTRQANIPFEMVPAAASTRMQQDLMEGLEPYEYAQLLEFSMEYLSGMLAESYDIDAGVSNQRFMQRANEAITQVMSGTVTGYSSVSGVNVQAQPQQRDTLYVMLPVWTMMAKYNGKQYTFAMNGQTGKMVGKLPISGKRAAAWFFALAGGISALAVLFTMLGGLLS